MRFFPPRLAAVLAAGAVTLTLAACEDRNENQINEGPESDEPGATIQSTTSGLGPTNTQTDKPTTQERQPLTPTSP
jgi:hypothetical protein